MGALKESIKANIPTKASKSESWISYHKVLKKEWGKKAANAAWTYTWGLRGSKGANTNDLRDYMGKQGVVIDKSSWDSIVDAGADAKDFFGDFLKMGQFAGMALLFILIGGVGLLIYNIARQPVKVAQTAITARGMKGLK